MAYITGYFSLIGALFLIDASETVQSFVPMGEVLSALAAPIAVIGALVALLAWRSDAKE